MSIQSEITRIASNVSDAFDAAQAKGATMPATENSDNLATTISTIPSGTTPTGTKSITSNGVYDVTDFASADVQVPTVAPDYYLEYNNDNGTIKRAYSFLDLTGVYDVSSYCFYYAFYYWNPISGVISLGDVENVSGTRAFSYAFSNSEGPTSFIASKLKKITGERAFEQAFGGCINLRSVSLPNLEILQNSGLSSAFRYSSLQDGVDVSKIKYIGYLGLSSAFRDTQIPDTRFDSLITVDVNGLQQCFNGSYINLRNLYFPSLKTASTNSFQNLLSGVSSAVTIHFPKNLDPNTGSTVVSSLTGYPSFGGTNVVLAFDLPSSSILLTGSNSNVYQRNPKYDSVSSLAWRKQDTGSEYSLVDDWTPYYTSGTTEPVVGATIYSDSACTIAVTTVSAIA